MAPKLIIYQLVPPRTRVGVMEMCGNCLASEFPTGSYAFVCADIAPSVGDLAMLVLPTPTGEPHIVIKRISYRTDSRGNDTLVYESDARVPIILRPNVRIVGKVVAAYVPPRPRVTLESRQVDAETAELVRHYAEISRATDVRNS